jgi:hypothetical protein
MADILRVIVNETPTLEYDRGQALPKRQLEFLDRMDRELDQGIQLNGETIRNPNELQRAQYVAIHLIQALWADNESLAAAMCTYLANRLPELQELKATEEGANQLSLELVFDQQRRNQVVVNFSFPESGSSKLH